MNLKPKDRMSSEERKSPVHSGMQLPHRDMYRAALSLVTRPRLAPLSTLFSLWPNLLLILWRHSSLVASRWDRRSAVTSRFRRATSRGRAAKVWSSLWGWSCQSHNSTVNSESRCVPVAGQVGQVVQVVQVGDPVETYNVHGIASFPGSSAPEREIEFTCVHFTFQRAWEWSYMVDISSYKPHTQTLIIHTWEQGYSVKKTTI